MKINRNRISDRLYEISSKYHERIPLGDILGAVKDNGLTPIQEDGSPWSGFLCGDSGEVFIDLEGSKRMLVISWYRMDSGRFEVNAYLS